MLSQNQCAEAFWLGTLKNRDLHGVELQDDSLSSCRTSTSLMSESIVKKSASARGGRGRERGHKRGRKVIVRDNHSQLHRQRRRRGSEDSDAAGSSSSGSSNDERTTGNRAETVASTSMRSLAVRLDRVIGSDLNDLVDQHNEVGENEEGDLADETEVETVADDDDQDLEDDDENVDNVEDMLLNSSEEEEY